MTYAMGERHQISFKSYDRLFPNQDTMPDGGFGNLIALPLQKKVRDNGNAVFISEDFNPYPDQWQFLSGIQKLNEKDLTSYINRLTRGNDLGLLKEETSESKPWQKQQSIGLKSNDFPKTVKIQ